MRGFKVLWGVVILVCLIAASTAEAARWGRGWGGKCGDPSCEMCYGTRYYQPQTRTVKPVTPKMAMGAYTCPMHPGVKSNGPARCPKCGMDLVRAAKKMVMKKAPAKRKARPNPKAPTPQAVVVAMLELAGVGRNDKLVDLGCGDGRIVVTAAKRYGCRAGGHDTDPAQVKLARANVKRSGVSGLVNIGRNDVMDLDISMATVVTVYLPTRTIGRLMPKFERELAAGTRIVSHNHPLPGVRVDRVVTARDGTGRDHRLYLYVTPLRIDFSMIR